MSDYITTVGMIVSHPRGSTIEDERATSVRLCDEGAGPFCEIEQNGADESMTIRLDPDEWPTLRRAINKMMRIAAKGGGS